MEWLPKHKCGLYLEHNEHRDYYENIEDYYEEEMFISKEEYLKALKTDNVWKLQWYPETPIGCHILIASTLEAIKKEVEDNI